jgi:ribonuclease R
MTVWDALGVHCSANERRADEASRDVENWLKCYFMQDKLGEEYTGIITGVTTFGIFVQLDQLFVEGLVHITDLGQDYFQYDDARHELKGERSGKKFQLTDRVSVQVVRVDLESRKIDLRLAGVDAVAPRPDAPSKANKTNIKPGPAIPAAKPSKPARKPAAAAPTKPAAAAAPKAAARKTKAAPAAKPRAVKQAAPKSKKKR